ncbi:MAG: sigma factor SigF [Synechococcaceae cyanobacterium]
MLPPFSCGSAADAAVGLRRHPERKRSMLTFWRDGVERQLAALNAAISTLERQMQRGKPLDVEGVAE